MKKLSKAINYYVQTTRAALIDDKRRCEIMFQWLNYSLTIIAFGMSIINLFTDEVTLMMSTLCFSVLCLINTMAIKTKVKNRYVYMIFCAEALSLITFFFVTGIPNGFSALWVLLIPSFSLLIFGRKNGSMFSALTWLILVILFWAPGGKSLLLYKYSETFMLRFPFLYSAIFALSFIVESVRNETNLMLTETEKKYRYLYRHDALTGLYSRYGFNEVAEKIFQEQEHKFIAAMIVDIDDFKNVNDRYGHTAGDEVLKIIAKIISETLCEHCLYCRWGGEEFLILIRSDHDIKLISEKLRKK